MAYVISGLSRSTSFITTPPLIAQYSLLSLELLSYPNVPQVSQRVSRSQQLLMTLVDVYNITIKLVKKQAFIFRKKVT